MATVRNANEIDPAKLAFEIDATAASRPNEPSRGRVPQLLEPDAKFCEFVQQNQAKLKVSPGRSLSKIRSRRWRQAQTVPVVDMSNYLITERATSHRNLQCKVGAFASPARPELAFKPYDNEAISSPT
eukprot:tig00000144_g9198.t1